MGAFGDYPGKMASAGSGAVPDEAEGDERGVGGAAYVPAGRTAFGPLPLVTLKA